MNPQDLAKAMMNELIDGTTVSSQNPDQKIGFEFASIEAAEAFRSHLDPVEE